MKKQILKVVAKAAEATIKKSDSVICSWWTYQPKAPKDIKNFKK